MTGTEPIGKIKENHDPLVMFVALYGTWEALGGIPPYGDVGTMCGLLYIYIYIIDGGAYFLLR